MKRALLQEMTHEWRINIWLVVELAVVSLAIWAILTLLWVQCQGLFYPLGFNPERVYTIDVKNIPESSPYFLSEYKDSYYQDRKELIRRLRNNPNIEAVSLHSNFAPYEYNYMGNGLFIDGKDSIFYTGNFRYAEPDIIDIMEIRSLTGKNHRQLRKMLSEGKILISQHENFENRMGDIEKFIGKEASNEGIRENGWVIGDVVERVRRSNYEYNPEGVVIFPIDVDKDWGNIILKVKPGKEKNFIEDFNSDRSLSHLRNIYLSNLKSLVKKGESIHREIEINIRLMVSISFFLLITIFLGLLGSFWFRVQQRISEIAIRKTYGASNKDLFRRIIGEGLILLLAGLVLVSVCIWPFIREITDTINEAWWTLLILEGIAAGMIALCIVLSLWYPSWRAMKIEPAIAVKEE
ncbi:MAG: FtsX-like permease family protein [Muribaculaceae bacterium]|nr:FtsX-like permease family protein [Muribaculaceae bacterium]